MKAESTMRQQARAVRRILDMEGTPLTARDRAFLEGVDRTFAWILTRPSAEFQPMAPIQFVASKRIDRGFANAESSP